MKPFVDISGETFNRLTVLHPSGQSRNKSFLFTCICICGTVKVCPGHLIVQGKIKSCGCLRRETLSSRHALGMSPLKTHGHCTKGISPTYRSWLCMKRRCSDPSMKEFKRYAGRGIFVCEKWMKFENFLSDMGERPRGHTLDRIWNHLGYFPGNCKWSTPREQTNNRGTGWISNGVIYGMGEGI
jgi:hypothetical protein